MKDQKEVPHLVSSKAPGAELVRLADGAFHVYRLGKFPNLITGFNHILVSERLAGALRGIAETNLEMVPVRIVGIPPNVEVPGYFELIISEKLTPKSISTVDSSGIRVWQFRDEYFFVSPDVMRALSRKRFDDLSFDPGFSSFAGIPEEKRVRTVKAGPFPADFEAEFQFLLPEEGGRKSGPPFQGYRSDFLYAEDRLEDGMHMIWPEFLDSNGHAIAKGGQAPRSGKANFYIINDELRAELHQYKMKVGTKFFMMEGPYRVATGRVTRILGLRDNIVRLKDS